MPFSLMIVPPLVKYTAGPLLGPAMLAGAAAAAGHRLDVVDLNALYMQGGGEQQPASGALFFGDHRKPSGWLATVESRFRADLAARLGPSPHRPDRLRLDPVAILAFSHAAVRQAAEALASGADGEWIAAHLRRAAPDDRPLVICISLMFSGQVVWGMAAALVARRLWPAVPVLCGGAHVTGLAQQIATDPEYGFAVDRFVAGYAERTMIDILDALAKGEDYPDACFAAGDGSFERARDDAFVMPRFDNLNLYDNSLLTLPAQVSRGCAYGRCTFCTYPSIEGLYRPTMSDSFARIVALAEDRHAAVSLKDSLLTPAMMRQIAATVDGRVAWSGCTKLNVGLPDAFAALSASGCRTLELGIESFVAHSQELADKSQSFDLFLRALDGAAGTGVALVINYMTGFPGEDEAEADMWMERVRSAVAERGSQLVARIEHNRFELERLAPLAVSPDVKITQSWPWATVMDWVEQPQPAGCRA